MSFTAPKTDTFEQILKILEDLDDGYYTMTVEGSCCLAFIENKFITLHNRISQDPQPFVIEGPLSQFKQHRSDVLDFFANQPPTRPTPIPAAVYLSHFVTMHKEP